MQNSKKSVNSISRNDLHPNNEEPQHNPDRRAVLAKFARNSAYVAPLATMLLLRSRGSAVAMSGGPDL